MRNGVVALVVLAVVGLVGTLAVLAFRPPAPLADAPADEFAAGRAEAHLGVIAREPHPIGTTAQTHVLDYIAETARSFGAGVEVEHDPVVTRWRGVSRVASVRNIVAKVPGTAPDGKALLVVGHYDSVPTGPGAADDGAAVAAMLETLRALSVSGPVARDVVFLFTDGEEVGLLGAQAYVNRHGVDGIGAVLNFEARGSGGPVWMFQTGPGSAPLVSAFGEASSRPIANSLAVEVYRRMPNNTDFTVFADAGVPGLNSAFIEHVHHYHAPTDDLAHLDRGSVQHHGETMLGLVRALGGTDLMAGGESVYFDLFSRVLVDYPLWLAYVLAGLTVVGLLAALGRAAPSVRGTAAVAGAGLGALVAAAVLAVGVWQLVAATRPELGFLPLSEPYGRGWFVGGFMLLALAVLALAVRLVRGRSRAELVAGPLVLTALLLAVTLALMPGASFLFQWPLLAGLPALWWSGRGVLAGAESGVMSVPAVSGSGRVVLPGGESGVAGLPAVPRSGSLAGAESGVAGLSAVSGSGHVVLAGVGPVVAAAMYPPLVGTMLVALGMPLVAVGIAFALLAGVLLMPVLAALPRPAFTVLVPLVCALALLTSGVAGVGFSREAPRPDSLVYFADGGRAHWLTPDPAVDAWTAKVIGADAERVDLSGQYPMLADPVLRAPAPSFRLPQPAVRVLDDTTAAGVRRVRLEIVPSPSAWRTQVALPPTCHSNGTPLLPIAELYGPATITCTGTGPLTLDLTDHWIGLPEQAAAMAGPRPSDSTLVPSGVRMYDSALVRVVVTV